MGLYGNYGFVWIEMVLYGIVWKLGFCMDDYGLVWIFGFLYGY